MKINNRLWLFTLILIAVTTLCKFFFGPKLGWSGVSPVYAIGLFSGMLMNDKSKSFFLPLIAVFASDMIMEVLHSVGLFPYSGFYTYQLLNYALLVGTVLIGWALKGKSYSSLALGAFAAPTLFFLVSNMGAWMIDPRYVKNFTGLLASYEAGLPFYRNAIAATFVFLPAIIVGYNYIVKRTADLRLA